MMSLWPWKTDTSSPASFEKALSKLSTQITSATLSVETTQSRARRLKALWTVYTTLTYLVYTLVLALVLGPQRWGPPHYAGLVGAPLVIYAIREVIALFFTWQLSNQQSYLSSLQKQRETKITDLKKATKYDSTQELLEKYGGGGAKPAQARSPSDGKQGTKRKVSPLRKQQPQQQPRTGLPPPPTANLPGRMMISNPSTPQRLGEMSGTPTSARAKSPFSARPMMNSLAGISPEEPEFAPNAFGAPLAQSRTAYDQPGKWYDRILDVLLGEDETLAKNRLALICSNCRLVNGQAPPGVKTPEQLGKWKCSSCGAWNGIETEAAKIVREMQEQDRNVSNGWEKISKGGEEELSSPQTDGAGEGASPELDAAKEIRNSEEDIDERAGSEDDLDEDASIIGSLDKRTTRSTTRPRASELKK